MQGFLGSTEMKLLFLDIDGCLNNHEFMAEAESCTICRSNVIQLNRIHRDTGSVVVLSSAWRYMIGENMSLQGFSYMLRTHGMSSGLKIVGTTIRDEECAHCGMEIECGEDCYRCGIPSTRADQVDRYLKDNPCHYVIIDDCDFGFSKDRFVKPDANIGLTEADADRAIAILNSTTAQIK